MQRVALINGKNKNQDYDLSKIFNSIATSGIVEGLEVQSGKVIPGYAFIEVERNGIIFNVLFENTEDFIIDTTGTKKVFIEINQSNINDGSINLSDGSGIGEIKTALNYPTTNFIGLASITGGVITDSRIFTSFKGLKRKGLNINKILYVNENGEEVELSYDPEIDSGKVILIDALGGLKLESPSVNIGDLEEITSVNGVDEFILNRVGGGNKKVKSQNLFLYNSALSGIVGEAISKGNGLCIPSIIGEGTITQNTHSNIYGWVYGDSYGQTAVVAVGVKIKTITGYIQSTGNAITLRCEIFTGVGGISLGYVDVGIASNSPAGDKTFTFSSPITATTSTIYIKFTRIAGTGASGPYTATNNPYANGSFYFNDVIVNNNDLRFSIIYDILNNENKLFKTDVTKTDRRTCLGTAENDAAIDEEVIYTEKGLSKSLTGFSKGDNLYLHNSTPGLFNTTINSYGLIGVMIQADLFDVLGTPLTNNSIGNISSSFGFGTNYLAPSSGFVIGYVWTSSAVNRASCYVGDTSPASTLVLKSGGDSYSGYGGFCFPVKKGQYWRVDVSNGSITESKVSFIPNI